MRYALLLIAVAATFSVSCSDGDEVSEISGIVVAVESSGLTEVDSFSVRSEDRTYEFLVTDETELAFAPAHLNEHRVSGEPVAVSYERKEDEYYALTVDDA